jgi:hypothetical protein
MRHRASLSRDTNGGSSFKGGGRRPSFPFGEQCTGLEITLRWLSCTYQETPQAGVIRTAQTTADMHATCPVLQFRVGTGSAGPPTHPSETVLPYVFPSPGLVARRQRELKVDRFSAANLSSFRESLPVNQTSLTQTTAVDEIRIQEPRNPEIPAQRLRHPTSSVADARRTAALDTRTAAPHSVVEPFPKHN